MEAEAYRRCRQLVYTHAPYPTPTPYPDPNPDPNPNPNQFEEAVFDKFALPQ